MTRHIPSGREAAGPNPARTALTQVRGRHDHAAVPLPTEIRTEERDGWLLRSSGPADARHTTLLLPGGLSTARMFDPVLSDPRMASGNLRLIAATPPGFGGRPEPPGDAWQWYVDAAARMADRLGADLLGGHSLGANFALGAVVAGLTDRPLVLLSPSFSMGDEERGFQRIARLSRVPGVGAVLFRLIPFTIDSMVHQGVPEQYEADVAAEMRTTDMRAARRQVVAYFRYLSADPRLAQRLAGSHVPALVVFGDRDAIGITAEESAALGASRTITLVRVPHSGHMLMQCNPAETLTEILRFVATLR